MAARFASMAALQKALGKGFARVASAMPLRARPRQPKGSAPKVGRLPRIWDLPGEAKRDCDIVSIVVPLPPPLSRCFRNHGARGRVKTRDYRQWISRALRGLVPQRPGRVPGDVRVHIVMRRKDAFSDGDNRLKGLGDILKRSGIIRDDSLLQRYTIEWLDLGSTVRLEVRPYVAAGGRAPLDVRCTPCGHRWVAGHYPDAIDELAAVTAGLRCPACGTGAHGLTVDRPLLPPPADDGGDEPR